MSSESEWTSALATTAAGRWSASAVAGRLSTTRTGTAATVIETAMARRLWWTLAMGATGVRPSSSTTRSEEHTSELQSLMRISYAVFCLNKKKKYITYIT